jgi:hypothetical protein
MNNSNRTSPIGLARYAREYFDAAIAADDVLGMRPGYEIVAPPPVMFLVAHSIELALKSYLLHKGASIDELKNKLSHKLTACWNAAKEQDIENYLNLSSDELKTLKLIGDLHSSTELRYIQTGFKDFPVFGPLQQLASKILNTICPLVGYK